MASPFFSDFPSVFPSNDFFSPVPTVADEFDLQLSAIPTQVAHTAQTFANMDTNFAMESPLSSNSSDVISDDESRNNTPRSPQQHQHQFTAVATQAAALEQQMQAHALQLQLFNIVQAQQHQVTQPMYAQQHVQEQQAQLFLLQQQQRTQTAVPAHSHALASAQPAEASVLLDGNSAATVLLASMIPHDQQSQFTAFVESVKHQNQNGEQLMVQQTNAAAKSTNPNESNKPVKANKSKSKGKPAADHSQPVSGLNGATVRGAGSKCDEHLFNAPASTAAAVNGNQLLDAGSRQILKVKRSATAMQTQSTAASSPAHCVTVSSDLPALSYGSSSASSDELEVDGLVGDEEEDADAKRRRLARKAELARMSRKRKKTRMGDLEAEVDRLQKEIAALRKQLTNGSTAPAQAASCSASALVGKIATPITMPALPMKAEHIDDGEHEVKKVYDAIQQVILAHKHAEEVNQQSEMHQLAKKAKREEISQSSDAEDGEQQEDDEVAAVRQDQERANKNVLSAMDFLVHLHTRSVDVGASHLLSLRPHLVPILPLHFLHWLMSQADSFYDDPQSLWSSLFLHELKLNHQQMKDLSALRTTVRKQGKLLTDIEKGYRKLQTALKKQFTQRVENLEKIRSILDTTQLAKFLQWVQQYGPLCLKVQQNQASIQPAQVQSHTLEQPHHMHHQLHSQAQPQEEQHNMLNAVRMQHTAPDPFLLDLAAH